jgi:hypothetical protein
VSTEKKRTFCVLQIVEAVAKTGPKNEWWEESYAGGYFRSFSL